MTRFGLIYFAICIVSTPVQAQRRGEKPAEPPAPANKPLISRPVQVVASDNFNRPAIGPNWKVNARAEGQFQLVQGVLAGQTTSREGADAGINAKFPAPCRNLGLTFKIKLGTANTAGVGVGGKPAGNSGYIAAIWFNKTGVQVNADAGKLDRTPKVFPRDEWLDVMMEIVGNRVVVQVNGEKVIDGENASIGKDTKKHVAFVVAEGGAAIDDIMAGEVVPIAK